MLWLTGVYCSRMSKILKFLILQTDHKCLPAPTPTHTRARAHTYTQANTHTISTFVGKIVRQRTSHNEDTIPIVTSESVVCPLVLPP